MKLPWLLLLMPIFAWANITPNTLSENIAASGAKQVVANFKQDDWNVIFSGVASGKKEWLDIVPMLAPVIDAARSNSLEDALASALTTNTPAALKTLDVLDAKKYPFMIGSDLVCVPPLDKSKDEILTFYNKTREALLDNSEGAKCLWILESSMNEWQHSQQAK